MEFFWEWFCILALSPAWGMTFAQFIFQIIVFAGNSIICLIGMFLRKVPFKDNLFQLCASLLNLTFFIVFFIFTYWLAVKIFKLYDTLGEKITFWIFAVSSSSFFIPQVKLKFLKQWFESTFDIVPLDNYYQKRDKTEG
ncbi:MAG: hypothetical protein AB7E04_06850 [Desulfobacteraceae bacterium]|jgi:hypothetical protein